MSSNRILPGSTTDDPNKQLALDWLAEDDHELAFG